MTSASWSVVRLGRRARVGGPRTTLGCSTMSVSWGSWREAWYVEGYPTSSSFHATSNKGGI